MIGQGRRRVADDQQVAHRGTMPKSARALKHGALPGSARPRRAARRGPRYIGDVTTAPQEHQELIRRVLGANYLDLALGRLVVDEDPDGQTSANVRVVERGQEVEMTGSGVGVVDAIYAALLARYAAEYQSLRSIRITGFQVSADIDGTRAAPAGADAMGTVTIDVLNSEGKRFTFADTSRSVTASIGRAVVAVVAYFVNAERAFMTLWSARQDALERGRADLVQRYTSELAEVVESTSYADVIESKKRSLR